MPTIKPKVTTAKAPVPQTQTVSPSPGIVPVPVQQVAADTGTAGATDTAATAGKERGLSLTWNNGRLKALIKAIRFGKDGANGEREQHTPKSLIEVLKVTPAFNGVAELITPEKLRLVTKWLRDVAGPAHGKDFSDIVLAREAGGFVSRKRDLDWDDLAGTEGEAM